jgi:hypothetical protein
MLFPAESAHGILKAEAGIVNRQMMKLLNIIVQVFTIQCNTSVLPKNRDDFYRQSLNSFVAVSRILRQRGKEKAMCIVHMHVQCSDTYSELFVGDVEHTELTIESIVGTALLEVFDTVLVENVTVHHSRERNDRDGEQR